MTPAPAATKVLSVVGPGRSGTTILGNILGEVEGIVNAGEMRWLWRRGLLEQRPCGCGLPPVDCTVWSAVLDRMLGGRIRSGTAEETAALVGEVIRAQREVGSRHNRFRTIRAANGAPTSWEATARMRATTEELCGALAAVTGARVIVETSKLPHDAALLAGAAGIDHYVLHVVRDPRAVAYSWRRPKPLRVSNGTTTMATQGLLASAGRWGENCLGAELLRRHVPPSRWSFLRYEDFVAAPRAAIEQVLAFIGVDGAGPFVDEDTVELGVNHTLAGNPNRFRTGAVRIVEDDEWTTGMTGRDQAAIAAITMPLLLRYGYPIRGSARRRAMV